MEDHYDISIFQLVQVECERIPRVVGTRDVGDNFTIYRNDGFGTAPVCSTNIQFNTFLPVVGSHR